MALQDSLDVLVKFGVFNESAIDRLAAMVTAVESLAGGSAPSSMPKRRGRPAGSRKAASGGGKPRGRRAKVNVSKEELKKLYIDQGMTGKELAAKFGVSPVTISLWARKMGISKRKKK